MGMGTAIKIGLLFGVIFCIISMIIGAFTHQNNPYQSLPDYSEDNSQNVNTVDYQVGMTDKQISMKDYNGDGKPDTSSDTSK